MKLFSFKKIDRPELKESVGDYTLILIGSFIQALGMVYFLIPARLISGGISGLAQVINHYTALPIGTMTLIGNIPLFILGWRYLGGRKFALRTVFAVALFSLFTDLLTETIGPVALTHDLLLNSLFGASILGVGFGLVYRGSGTSGGTDIVGRILNQRLGVPLTQSYLVVDSISVILGGIAFGWDLALYGMIAIYVSGEAAEMITVGSAVFRSVIVISEEADAIAETVMTRMGHGVTFLDGTGAYSGQKKKVVYVVIGRSEVNLLKRIIHKADPNAFMVVGHAAEVLGEGFQPYKTLPE